MGLSQSTARTYYKAMDFLLKDQLILDLKNIDIDLVVSKLKQMKYKNQYSKYKNAFIKFCDYLNIKLDSSILEELAIMKNEKKKRYRKLKEVELKNIKNHIRVIRDEKLKLSFQIMLLIGLRVSELTQIQAKDCLINSNSIELSFIGKGGNKESVLITDTKIFEAFKKLLSETRKGEKIFYSTNYLQSKAKKMKFQCHDLRRAFAKLSYKKHKNLNQVMKEMRHSKKHNTKIYLNSKVKI